MHYAISFGIRNNGGYVMVQSWCRVCRRPRNPRNTTLPQSQTTLAPFFALV